MKRLIALILLCFMPGLASAQGYQLVEYAGVAYESSFILTVYYAVHMVVSYITDKLRRSIIRS